MVLILEVFESDIIVLVTTDESSREVGPVVVDGPPLKEVNSSELLELVLVSSNVPFSPPPSCFES